MLAQRGPAVSAKASQRIRHTIRSWRLHRRTGTSLDELACTLNPVLRGWINYYSHYCPSALTPTFQYLNLRLARWGLSEVQTAARAPQVLFITLNCEDFSFVIHLDRQPRTSRRREAQTGSRARSGSRSERTLDAVEHSRTLMEWWPFLIFHRGGLRIKVINNSRRARRWLRGITQRQPELFAHWALTRP